VSQITGPLPTGACPCAVTVQRGALIAMLLQNWLVNNLQAFPGPIITAAKAIIATQNATIVAAITGAATIIP
jgi:hypothetical protein